MKHILFISLALLASPLARAEERVPFAALAAQVTREQPLCFGREFSPAHMQAHAAQKVQLMRTKLSALPKEYGENTDGLMLYVEAVLRGDKNQYRLWRASLYCARSTGHCSIDCDGGGLEFQPQRDGSVLLENHGFVVQGGCGEDAETVFLEATKGGDDLFRLARLPAAYCAAN